LLARKLKELYLSGMQIRGQNNQWFGSSPRRDPPFSSLNQFQVGSGTFVELDLRQCPNLQHFFISDDGESSIQKLVLVGFRGVQDCGLQSVSSSLRELKLIDPRAEIEQLDDFRNLKSLHFQSSIRSDASGHSNQSGSPDSIKNINLTGCKGLEILTFEGTFPNLEVLNVSGCPLKEVVLLKDQAPKLSFFTACNCKHLNKVYIWTSLRTTNSGTYSRVDVTGCVKLTSESTQLFLGGFVRLNLEYDGSRIDRRTAEKWMD
jgi:hypothetical protein